MSDFYKMIFGSVVRGIANSFAGWIAANGVANGSTQSQIVGAVTLLASIGWSIWQKYGASAFKIQAQHLLANPTVPINAKLDAKDAAK